MRSSTRALPTSPVPLLTLPLMLVSVLLLPLLAAGAQVGNPLLEKYRAWAAAYERDAKEAEEAARKYASMAKAIGHSHGGAAVQTAVRLEMDKLRVRPWANAVWQFEEKLRDPRPARAAAAAKKAAEPYEEEYRNYERRQRDFEAAAQTYAQRVGADAALAKSLATYSNQYGLEGNHQKSAEFRKQAETLMQQVKKEQSLAEGYHKTAGQLHGALHEIQDMAGRAGAFAAYHENPTGALPAEHLFPFTVAPPLVPEQ